MEQIQAAIDLLKSIAGSSSSSSTSTSTSTVTTVASSVMTIAGAGTPGTSSGVSSGSTSSDMQDFIESRTNRIMSNFTSIRDRMDSGGRNKRNKPRPACTEMKKLFPQMNPHGPKRRKASWTHRFVCLANHQQTAIPTTSWEKDELIAAGLGEVKVVFEDPDCNADDFRQQLFSTFPKLKNGGGYQLCKCKANSRELQPLSGAVLTSPRALQGCGGNSRTYIRPLQTDLDLSSCDYERVQEKCLKCGELVAVDEFCNHLKVCQLPETVDLTDGNCEKMSDNGCAVIDTQRDEEFAFNLQHQILVDDIEKSVDDISDGSYTCYSPIPPVYSPISSPVTHDHETYAVNCENPNIKQLIRNLETQNYCTSSMSLEFRREFCIEDAIRHSKKAKFDPLKQLKVIFVGEAGEDTGGLRREFWRLFVYGAADKYFIGCDDSMTFQQDVLALQNLEYTSLGQLIAMSIIQDGFGLPILAPPVYNYIVSNDLNVKISLNEIPDPTIKHIVSLVHGANTEQELRDVFADEDSASYLFETGYKGVIDQLTLPDKDAIANILGLYHTLVKVKAPIDQFILGLQCVKGLYESIKSHPEVMKPLFVKDESKVLTADGLKFMLQKKYSSVDSNQRQREEQSYMFFVDFLDECEEGNVGVKLSDVLIFFTGADRIPPLGFSLQPTLQFISGQDMLATASTCNLTLNIPTSHTSYQTFKDFLILSFLGHGGIHCI